MSAVMRTSALLCRSARCLALRPATKICLLPTAATTTSTTTTIYRSLSTQTTPSSPPTTTAINTTTPVSHPSKDVVGEAAAPFSNSDASLSSALAHLRVQNNFYAKIHIQGNAYIVTQGDVIHLPFRLVGTRIGDVLRIVSVSSFGSRDYTLTQSGTGTTSSSEQGVLDRDARFLKTGQDGHGRVACRVTVVEHTKQPLFTTIKKKRRNRHAKAHTSKQPYTVLRVSQLSLAP